MLCIDERRESFDEAVRATRSRWTDAIDSVDCLIEEIGLAEAAGRVLAERVVADRDYPPVARSVRDGFAVRAADLPGELDILGEVRAGETFAGEMHAGQAVEIMTGAPVPRGADAVVMVEHVTVAEGRVTVPRSLQSGENISPQASQARQGDVLLEPGRRLGFAEAIMREVVRQAQQTRGISRTVLQATSSGLSLYEAMGYRTVTSFNVFISD